VKKMRNSSWFGGGFKPAIEGTFVAEDAFFLPNGSKRSDGSLETECEQRHQNSGQLDARW
jgi:hypothetical protein